MTIQNPIGDQPQDPFGKYRAERIEADKQTKDEQKKREAEPQSPTGIIGAYFLLMVHRFLDLFEDTSEKGLSSTAEKQVRDNLLLIKSAFDTMKKEDRSQDAPFLNHLSELWHRALEDILKFRRETALALQFKKFIRDVDSYPENKEFSFGYYLTQYAGQKWLPFPYMELVMKIHSEHEKNPEGSALARWTEQIAALAKKLGPETL
jgi:hypothetical protein